MHFSPLVFVTLSFEQADDVGLAPQFQRGDKIVPVFKQNVAQQRGSQAGGQ